MQCFLESLFLSLPIEKPPTDEGVFPVLAIPKYDLHYIGKSSEGRPHLFISNMNGDFRSPISLALVDAVFNIPCLIREGKSQVTSRVLSVISCRSDDSRIHSYFFHACEMILRILGEGKPSLGKVSESFQKVIELFQNISKPSFRSLKGIIGELFLIYSSRNAVAAIRSWRSNSLEHFDFSSGSTRIDVKVSSQRQRVHQLSAEQCNPPDGTVGLLASLFIESSGGGMSLHELVTEIEAKLASEDALIFKLQKNLTETLGNTLGEAFEFRFDEMLAKESLQYYDLREVPAVRSALPPEVTGVHFCSDLGRTLPLSKAKLKSMRERIGLCF